MLLWLEQAVEPQLFGELHLLEEGVSTYTESQKLCYSRKLPSYKVRAPSVWHQLLSIPAFQFTYGTVWFWPLVFYRTSLYKLYLLVWRFHLKCEDTVKLHTETPPNFGGIWQKTEHLAYQHSPEISKMWLQYVYSFMHNMYSWQRRHY